MLDTLEREYRTIEDIHEKLKIYTDDEIQKVLVDRLEQLDENKHSFLRVRIFDTKKFGFFLSGKSFCLGMYSCASKI